jgi:hypothetical protein
VLLTITNNGKGHVDRTRVNVAEDDLEKASRPLKYSALKNNT